MQFVNLTPHAITLYINGTNVVLQPDPAGPARVGSTPGEEVARKLVGDTGCPVSIFASPTWGEVEGLPEPKDDTIYIVSTLVAERCGGRKDVCSPGTGPNDGAIRDGGRVTAVTRLIRAPLGSSPVKTTAQKPVLPGREVEWDDTPGTAGRGSCWCALVSNGKLYEFTGESIPGVVAVISKHYVKQGKWSHYDYKLRLGDGVEFFWGYRGEHLKASSWSGAAEKFEVTIDEARRFIKEILPRQAERLNKVESDLASLK